MLNILKLFTLSIFLVFATTANALHEPYVNENFQGIVTSGALAGAMVEIHIEGQTHNVFDGNDYTNEWSFSLDAGTLTFLNLFPLTEFNLLTDFQDLELSITQWAYSFDESEGLGSATPEHLLINGVWAASSPFGSTPVTISALIGLAGYKKSHNKFGNRDR